MDLCCVTSVCKRFPIMERVLRLFANRALQRLHQVNYVITYLNHFATLYEPITAEERAKHEQAQIH